MGLNIKKPILHYKDAVILYIKKNYTTKRHWVSI